MRPKYSTDLTINDWNEAPLPVFKPVAGAEINTSEEGLPLEDREFIE